MNRKCDHRATAEWNCDYLAFVIKRIVNRHPAVDDRHLVTVVRQQIWDQHVSIFVGGSDYLVAPLGGYILESWNPHESEAILNGPGGNYAATDRDDAAGNTQLAGILIIGTSIVRFVASVVILVLEKSVFLLLVALSRLTQITVPVPQWQGFLQCGGRGISNPMVDRSRSEC